MLLQCLVTKIELWVYEQMTAPLVFHTLVFCHFVDEIKTCLCHNVDKMHPLLHSVPYNVSQEFEV